MSEESKSETVGPQILFHGNLNEFLDQVFGIGPAIQSKTCSYCKVPVTGFRDQLSAKEYTMSGLCQKCQDEVFTPESEDK